MNKKTVQKNEVVVFSYIGNLGCVRFPEKIRKVSGIKRNDRLIINVLEDRSVVLEKDLFLQSLDVDEIKNVKRVSPCSCENPPKSCSQIEEPLVTAKVGWSYVELSAELATELGFLPNTPIKLQAQPNQIILSKHNNPKDLEGIKPVVCPP